MLCKKYLILTLLFCFTQAVSAEPIAGEISKREESEPHITFEPSHNITDILQTPEEQSTEPDIYFNADELLTNQKEQTQMPTNHQ